MHTVMPMCVSNEGGAVVSSLVDIFQQECMGEKGSLEVYSRPLVVVSE